MKNKIALVTGSTDGVGRVVAQRLAAQGALGLDGLELRFAVNTCRGSCLQLTGLTAPAFS